MRDQDHSDPQEPCGFAARSSKKFKVEGKISIDFPVLNHHRNFNELGSASQKHTATALRSAIPSFSIPLFSVLRTLGWHCYIALLFNMTRHSAEP